MLFSDHVVIIGKITLVLQNLEQITNTPNTSEDVLLLTTLFYDQIFDIPAEERAVTVGEPTPIAVPQKHDIFADEFLQKKVT